MKNTLLILSIFILCSCANKISLVGTKYQENETLIRNNSWNISVPKTWEVKPSAKYGMEVLLIDNSSKAGIFLLKNKFLGITSEFVKISIENLKNSGATIISTSNVEINGLNYIRIFSKKDIINSMFWITTYNGNQYSLGCSGVDVTYRSCDDIVQTFNITN